MSACTFFGHRECRGLDMEVLRKTITDLIGRGVDRFYVGHQGQFDRAVYRCLKGLCNVYPHICVCVVLAYPPSEKPVCDDMRDTMYPEIEGHPKFAIDRRNRWMIHASQYCICHIDHTWGGAYKFACMAKRRGLTVVNLGSADIKAPCGQ